MQLNKQSEIDYIACDLRQSIHDINRDLTYLGHYSPQTGVRSKYVSESIDELLSRKQQLLAKLKLLGVDM